MSTPVTMEDVCLYWLGFITARISIYLSASQIILWPLKVARFSIHVIYSYIQYRSFFRFFCLIMHVAHLQNISENTINVKALQVHILWHETHDSMSTTCKCGIMNDRRKGALVVHYSCWNFLFSYFSFFLLENFTFQRFELCWFQYSPPILTV